MMFDDEGGWFRYVLDSGRKCGLGKSLCLIYGAIGEFDFGRQDFYRGGMDKVFRRKFWWQIA